MQSATTFPQPSTAHRRQANKAVVATVIGNGLEWFDFTVYSFFSVIIAKVFFPTASELTSYLLALATFGVGFFMRPVGGILLGIYSDRRGRKAALSLTILLMAAGTLIIAVTPGYAQWGLFAPALIVFARLLQGFATAALAMLLLNIWSTQDNTIYNFAVAGCNLVRTSRRKTVTLAGALIGTALAVLGMYDLLVPYLVLLGTVIPPIGGVIVADFWLRHRGRYPLLAEARLPHYNWPGLAAYGLGTIAAFGSPWVAPLVGIGVAALGYGVFNGLSRGRRAAAPASL